MSKRYLHFDCEAHNAGLEYSMPPEKFVRLSQWAWDNEEPQMTTDLEQARALLREADYVVGHNIISADLGWVFGQDSIEPLEMAMAGKVIDTFVIASLVTPAPQSYQMADGKWATTYQQGRQKPELVMKYLSLANLSHQFGLPGKVGSLQTIAKRYNPPKTAPKDLDYSLIPLDDPEFVEYALHDPVAARDLWRYLQRRIRDTEWDGTYIWRELKLAAIASQITKNGVTINRDLAQSRVDELAEKRLPLMAHLVDNYDFPTEGKAPWSTTAGKEAIFRILADNGITHETRPNWTLTDTGNLSLGGETLIELTQGTPAEEMGEALASLKGQRSLAQLALDSIREDGLAHPDITALQRSGRWSMTKPGLTVWTKNEEKKYIVPAEGKVFAELDFSNADARAMGALSGDPAYNKRFETDENGEDLYDGHNLSGEALFSADIYYGDGPRDKKARPPIRAAAKFGGHGQNYNLGAFKMAHKLNEVCRDEGLDLHFWAPKHEKSKSLLPPIERRPDSIDTREMVKSFNETFVWLKKFKDDIVKEAETLGYVTNSWGRRMPVDKGREWNQAPALGGQSTTRDMMGDALIRLVERGEYYARCIKAIIHDALLTELDKETAEQDVLVVKECMEAVFNPKTPMGVPLNFPVSVGPLGDSWYSASHA